MHVRFAGQTVNEILEKMYRHCSTSQITLNVVPQSVTGTCVDSLAIGDKVMLCKPDARSQVLQASLLKSAIWTSVEEYHVL